MSKFSTSPNDIMQLSLDFNSEEIREDEIFHKFSETSDYKPVALSLFSGAGGLDIGFHKAGFKIVACLEIDKSCCQTLELNLGRYSEHNCKILNQDIRLLKPEDITIERVDFIIGGPPCQSFSAIGRRAGGVGGINDERGSLFEHYCRLVQYFQPYGFLFENVRGILGANKGKDWIEIVNEFAKLNYQISHRIIDCADYGVPQHRERLIMIGTRGKNIKFPRPSHGSDSKGNQPYVSALTALADLQDSLEPSHHYKGKYGNLLEEVPPGQNYHYFTREMGYPEPKFAWRSRFSDFLYKADPDKPVRTIVARLGAYSGPFHWKNRKFNLDEVKRLQTFPDDYNFAGGLNAALRQIGNSVPPLVAEHLAKAILQQIFVLDLGIELIEENNKLSFDSRKSKKAKVTRSNRMVINSNSTLFDYVAEKDQNVVQQISRVEEHFFHYISPRKRVVVAPPIPNSPDRVYRILTERFNEICKISVSKYDNGAFITIPLLRYNIVFNHLIGDGLEKIECNLLSDSPEDVCIAWDAIEDFLGENSGYQTMMDVYGHFTEPHPIFNLNLELFTNRNSFLLRFIDKFSQFEINNKILPESVLRELYEGNVDQAPFDLTTIAYNLRKLRFDIRVYETNKTIPIGYFRCCYPFTLNINKQVSVTWKNRTEGENLAKTR